MGLVSLIVLGLAVGAAAAVALLGKPALIAFVGVLGALWLATRFRVWERLGRVAGLPAFDRPNLVAAPRASANGASVMMLSVVAVSGGVLLANLGGPTAWQIAVVIGGAAFALLWMQLRRSYTIDGRLVLREMTGRRGRVSSTLLGLSVGIAGLSVVSLTSGAASHLLEVQLGENVEGNLLIGDPSSQHGEQVLAILSAAEGVESFSQVTTYGSLLLKVNGEIVEPPRGQFGHEADAAPENSHVAAPEPGVPMGLTVRTSLGDLPDYRMKNGRALRPDDAGQRRIMIRESFITDELGIKSGDWLTYVFHNKPGKEDDVTLLFRVVGVISFQSEQTGLEELMYLSILPPGALPETITPDGIATVAMIDDSSDVHMDQVLVALSDAPGVIAFELSALTQLAQNLLDQLKAIPTLVAWLALVAGTAIIANTVALATQERRREIGVMKAVGLKGRRVLGMLMIENGLIGLIAGLIGVAVGMALTVILVLASRNPGELRDTIEFSTMGLLILMSVGVAMGAAMFSAWSAAAEKPMNVLRYE
jgi:predicted lysophospholipase L1 biosynthesis ABC-type transport system permease subunit